jgi:hypothetical protein
VDCASVVLYNTAVVRKMAQSQLLRHHWSKRPGDLLGRVARRKASYNTADSGICSKLHSSAKAAFLHSEALFREAAVRAFSEAYHFAITRLKYPTDASPDQSLNCV